MNKKIVCILDAIAFIVLVWLDQLSKSAVVARLKDAEPYVLWDGVFELHYLENRGAAFGIMQNAKVFFLIAAVVLFAVVVYVLIRVPDEKKYLPWHFFCVLLAAGGLGNMIDRISQDYVTDFFYFKLINFPIFNVADIYVTVSTFLLVFYVICLCKEEDLAFLSPKKEK